MTDKHSGKDGSPSGSSSSFSQSSLTSNKSETNGKLSKNSKSSSTVYCVFKSTEKTSHMVKCESCSHWNHNKCVHLSPTIASSYPYICAFCVRSLFKKLASIEAEVASFSQRVSALEVTLSLHSDQQNEIKPLKPL